MKLPDYDKLGSRSTFILKIDAENIKKRLGDKSADDEVVRWCHRALSVIACELEKRELTALLSRL